MRRFLAIRDGTCRFPGCDKPTAATEADHTHAWAHGGDTDVDNLALLCPEHHRQKTLGYWKVRQIGAQQERQIGPQQATEQEAGQETGQETRHEAGQEAAHSSSSSPGAPPPTTPDSPPPPGTLEWTGPSGRKHRTCPHADPPPPF